MSTTDWLTRSRYEVEWIDIHHQYHTSNDETIPTTNTSFLTAHGRPPHKPSIGDKIFGALMLGGILWETCSMIFLFLEYVGIMIFLSYFPFVFLFAVLLSVCGALSIFAYCLGEMFRR